MEIIAKTNPNVSLIDHLKLVAETSEMLASKLSDNEDIIIMSYIAGLFHDIGKCTRSFQEHLTEGREDYATHNVSGYMFFKTLVSDLKINSINALDSVSNVILYHHPTSYVYDKDKVCDNIDEDDVDSMYSLISDLMDIVKEKYGDSVNISWNRRFDSDEMLEKVKNVDEPKFYLSNSDIETFFITNVVKPADVIASHYEKDKSKTIEEYFSEEMNRSVSDFELIKPEGYDERFDIQKDYAEKMISRNKPINLFDSQTGFGKTMLGILYLLTNNNKKGYWVCPQNSIADGVYRTVVKEISNLGLSDKVKVGLLLTGEFKEGGPDADIIVTNIDNMFGPVIKSDGTSSTLYRSYQLLYGNCIFDEFHEYVSESAIMATFDIVCKTRKNYCNKNENLSRVLLISATSVPFFENKYLKGDKDAIIRHDNEKLLNRKIHLSFVDTFNESVIGENYFFCTNAVRTAQEIKKNCLIDNIIHAQFLDSFKKERHDSLLNTHGKDYNDNSSWVSTSVASTGIDISFNNGVFLRITPDRFLQSIGRVDRWQMYDGIPNIIVSKEENNNSEKCALKCTSSKSKKGDTTLDTISGLFYDFLLGRFGEDSIITMRELYNARKDFYEENETLLKNFYKNTLQKSNENLKQIGLSYITKTEDDGKTFTSSKANLRSNGQNRKIYIQLKDNDTKEWIDEVIQVDPETFGIDKFDDRLWNDMLKECIPNKHRRKHCEGNTPKIKELLINEAHCSDKPLKIVRNVFHDKVLGIIFTD